MSNLVDSIKARADLADYARQRHGLDFKQKGTRLWACCPFHSEKTPSFAIEPDKQTWRCFGSCQQGGDIIAYVMRADQCDFNSALDTLCQHYGIERTRAESVRAKAEERRQGILKQFAELYQRALNGSQGAIAREYTSHRMISSDVLARWGLGYAPRGSDAILRDFMSKLGYSEKDLIESGAWTNRGAFLYERLIFPIQDKRGNVVALAGRTLSDSTPKYLNTPFEKSHHVYGLYQAASSIRTSKHAVLVEGYMDVIGLHQAGHTNVVAPMGVGLSEHQLGLLKDAERITLAFDGDDAGRAANLRAIERLLKTTLRVDVAILPDGKDPDDVAGEWEQIIAASKPALRYWLDAQATRPDSPIGERLKTARDLAAQVAQGDSYSAQLEIMREVADYYRINAEEAALMLKKPPLRIVEKPTPEAPKVKTPTHGREAYVLRCLLVDTRPLFEANRQLAILEMPELSQSDFPSLAGVWGIVETGMSQFDMSLADYVSQHAPDFSQAFGAYQHYLEAEAVRTALRLRFEALKGLMDYHAQQGEDMEGVIKTLKQINSLKMHLGL